MPKIITSSVVIGEIKDYGGGTLPEGYLLCIGAAVSRTIYADLFAAIGTTYGSGDGLTTFNLPNFARRVAMGVGGVSSGVIGNTVGSSGGSETHTLTIAEMPSHAHNNSDPGHIHNSGYTRRGSDQGGFTYDYLANQVGAGVSGTEQVGGAPNVGASTSNITVLNNGGGGAHTIVQPSLVVTKMIRY